MNCKFCNAELAENVTLCPVCGKENAEMTEESVQAAMPCQEAEEPETEVIAEESVEEMQEVPAEVSTEEPAEAPRQKPKVWLVVLAVIGALAIAAVLGIAVYFGISASKTAKSYSVEESEAIEARDTVIATVGDLELTNSTLQVCYWQAVNDFYNYYGYYLDASVLDFEKPMDEQFYDEENGVTWQQYFLNNALNSWSRYAALYMHGKEAGYTLSEDAQSYLDTMPDQLDEMAVSYGYETAADMLYEDLGPACDVDGYLNYLTTNFYASQYLDSLYDSMVPTDAEILEYYTQNEALLNEQGIANDGSTTVDVRHILICPKGGTEDENGEVTYSEEEWETCRQEAQELLDKWLAEDGTEDGFAQYAMTYTEDPGSMSTGGLYTDVYVGQMVEPFEDWCFDESRQYGDTGLVQTTYGYHIMFFVSAEEIWIANVRDTMVNERSLAIVDEAAAKWPMEVNKKKIVLGETAE